MKYLISLLFLCSSLLSANAQSVGIAIAEAPEQSSGVCVGQNAVQSLNCAKEKCARDPETRASDCLRVLWCYPMGWTADIFMQSSEVHWHEYSCGWSSQEQLIKAVDLKCSDDFLIECTAVRIWSHNGEEVKPELSRQD